ncbi:hypothetical protein SAMN05428970_3366 [Agromyces sp. CF514]|uniref:hypothetical protein n=1 Tax=Agromyces sp. CF514 TaxID=1881031 RepID=UPI0008E6703E|nr:hypothetical protein [Agromyces sp. CF514]SFR86907.1 hypothetical protein SAMN05428970_3366 [Agromyces sp. CF514]
MSTRTGALASTLGEHSFLRPARSARAASNIRSSHGGRRLAIGATIAAGIIIAGHLVHAATMAPYFPPGLGPWAGWFALAAVVAVGCVGWQVFRGMPDWLYVLLLAGLIAPAWLDIQATSGLAQIGVLPTAAPAVGAVLMPVSTIRSRVVPLVVACGVAAAILVEAAVQIPVAGGAAVPLFALAVATVLPVAVTVAMLRGFSRVVRHEADLSLVQSTVGTARSAVGMRASEELARLDFDAENLLEDVAAGRIGLPLSDADAAHASDLAARLRIRLIEGRNDTWLRHAVAESQYLSGRVQVDDPTGLAGPLSAAQREGLLLALWLLVADPSKPSAVPASVEVSCREPDDAMPDDADPDADDGHLATSVDITIHVDGVTHRRVDPATWDAVASVGVHQLVTAASGFRIEITCRIEPEAHAPGQFHQSGRPIEEKSNG